MIAIKIIDSQTFSVNDEPEPIHSSTIRKQEIEYSVLPLSEVIEKCTVIHDAPTSSIPWDIDGRKHDLYIIDQKYMLYQYIDVNYYNHPQRGSMWWQPLYEADKETQAKILEYADYDNRKDGYKFGPLYHATAEGQIQCIYKYGNKVYYRQIN